MSDIIKTIILLPLLDAIYFKIIADKFNKQMIAIQNKPANFRIIPAIFCYIALTFVLYKFIYKSDEPRNTKIFNAFLLGLCIYTVYETTNYTLLDNWHPEIVIIDSLWGGLLFALTTFLVTLKI
jgi:uncharacterized membrane protein